MKGQILDELSQDVLPPKEEGAANCTKFLFSIAIKIVSRASYNQIGADLPCSYTDRL